MMPNIGLGKIPCNIIYNCIGYFNSYSSPWMKKKKNIFFSNVDFPDFQFQLLKFSSLRFSVLTVAFHKFLSFPTSFYNV